MESYNSLAQAIVQYQEAIVGPLAWSEAEKVVGVIIKGKSVTISGEGEKVLEQLVKQYENLFGQASIEACRDAVRPLTSKFSGTKIPKILL